MKNYEGYEKSEAFTGEFETLEPGGYVCKITKVVCEEKPYGELLRISFDIEEGEHKEFYKRKFVKAFEANSEAKWQGMYYQTVKTDDLRYFKGFITAIENSNSGFKFDFDEQKLVGKLFGGVFGQEEYENSNGEVKLSTKCVQVRSVEKIREGVGIPEIKRLKHSATDSLFATATDSFFTVDSNDVLPF